MSHIFHPFWGHVRASKVSLVVKNLPLPASAGEAGSIPASGRSPGIGNGNLLQYSGLENSMDRGAQQDTVHGVAKSQTRLSTQDTHTHTHTHTHSFLYLFPLWFITGY